MSESVVERYLRLGLQIGRHVDGMVDAYFGPPELAPAGDVDPRTLVSAAEVLLDELETVGSAIRRSACARMRACWRATRARTPTRSRGATACVRPTRTRPSSKPRTSGSRSCSPATGRWPSATRAGRTRPACRRSRSSRRSPPSSRRARAQTRDLVGLPNGEGVDLEIVHDKPWWASCNYLGGLRSRVAVNVDLPMSAMELLVLALHETYPGHHAERSTKDVALVRGRGLLEETIVLVPTPQSLITEGIAKLAPEVLLDGAGGPALAAIVHDAGLEFDLAHARAVEQALEPCDWGR